MLIAAVAVPWPGAAGLGVKVPGCGHALATCVFGGGFLGDAGAVARSVSRGELPVLDPLVDDAGAAAGPAGRLRATPVSLVTSSVNPSRATPHLPEIPRSVSIKGSGAVGTHRLRPRRGSGCRMRLRPALDAA
jgi:hypothetical protein